MAPRKNTKRLAKAKKLEPTKTLTWRASGDKPVKY